MNKQQFSTNIMKKTLWAALLFCLPWTAPAQRKGNMSEMEQSMRKLSMAQLAISSLYVDSVDEVKLTEDAINGMLSKLDPHSSYTNAEETKKMNEPLQGNFDGIGVQFNMLEDTLVVIQPVAKGPSEKVGILAGDLFYTMMIDNLSAYIEAVISVKSSVLCAALVVVSYLLSLTLLKRKVFRVNMVECLKDNRA